MASLETLTRSIDLYVKEGIPTGGFLEAVISNDLKEAMGRADIESRHNLFDVVSYLYNKAPSNCWGSPKAYKEWLKAHAEVRRMAE